MNVAADSESCVASGNCRRVAPELFTSDEDGLVAVRQPHVAPEHEAAAEQAAEACPAAAITLT